jgi:hypothetical protein
LEPALKAVLAHQVSGYLAKQPVLLALQFVSHWPRRFGGSLSGSARFTSLLGPYEKRSIFTANWPS